MATFPRAKPMVKRNDFRAHVRVKRTVAIGPDYDFPPGVVSNYSLKKKKSPLFVRVGGG